MKNLFRASAFLGPVIACSLMTACNNKKHDHASTEQKSNTQEFVYACPMHPEVTGNKGEKCAKCGMKLERTLIGSKDPQVELETIPGKVEPGKPIKLVIHVRDGGSVVPLEIAHEKKMHLIIVSDDLNWFHHIHPEQQADGSFAIEETFPANGKYLLFVDHKPVGREQTVKRIDIQAGTGQEPSKATGDKTVSETGGFTVTLVNAKDLRTNRPQPLQISIKMNGKEIAKTALETYLGAVAHIVMINSTDKDFLHVHPEAGKDITVVGETFFEKEGLYRMWVQFKIADQLHTADFAVTVSGGKDSNAVHGGHAH